MDGTNDQDDSDDTAGRHRRALSGYLAAVGMGADDTVVRVTAEGVGASVRRYRLTLPKPR